MSSRLFTEVREKRGLAYEIVSNVKEYMDTGLFTIDAGIDNTKVKRAMNVIMKELAKLKEKAVKEEELSRAKEFFRGQFLMMLEGTLNYMIWLGDTIISKDEPLTNDEILNKIDQVTADDIKRVANRIFKDKNLKAAFIGPHKGNVKKEVERIITESL